MQLVGAANRTGDRLRLTPARPGTAGAVWAASKQAVAGGFVWAVRLRADTEQARARRPLDIGVCVCVPPKRPYLVS